MVVGSYFCETPSILLLMVIITNMSKFFSSHCPTGNKHEAIADGQTVEKVVTVSVFEMPVLAMCSNSSSNFVCSGMEVDLLKTIGCKIDWTLKFVQPKPFTNGYINSNGSWTGMIAMLLNGEANIGIELI
jgi:hypothetical protein